MKAFCIKLVCVMALLTFTLVGCEKDEHFTHDQQSNNQQDNNQPGAQEESVEGCLPGEFSVSATMKIKFSQGNLQYTTTGTHAVAGGGTATGTWRFAEHQWDYVGSPSRGGVHENSNPNGNVSGSDNCYIDSAYTGWIDLFCWGTSGWNSGAEGYQPYYSQLGDNDFFEHRVDQQHHHW